MHMDNKFGKISRISACAALKDGKTILEELSFTAPYKIMMPFERENGGIQILSLIHILRTVADLSCRRNSEDYISAGF